MSYKARTYRSGDWWSIEITEGLPANTLGVTQTRRLNNVHRAAQEVIADLLEIEPDPIEVDVDYDISPEIKRAKLALETAESDLSSAETIEYAARRTLVTAGANEGLTMREIGVVLGVSHQRVKQLLDTTTQNDENGLPRERQAASSSLPKSAIR